MIAIGWWFAPEYVLVMLQSIRADKSLLIAVLQRLTELPPSGASLYSGAKKTQIRANHSAAKKKMATNRLSLQGHLMKNGMGVFGDERKLQKEFLEAPRARFQFSLGRQAQVRCLKEQRAESPIQRVFLSRAFSPLLVRMLPTWA